MTLDLKRLFLALISAPLLMAPSAETMLSVGENSDHSFESLGPEFSIPLTVVSTPGRVLLFNYNQARRMGMSLPDKDALEKLLVNSFAFKYAPGYQPGPKDPPAKQVFATYYQDSAGIEPGHAQGDGRVAWIKELVFKGEDNRYHYLDISVKGIGTTPLAPSESIMPGHNHGALLLLEAIISFVNSELAIQSHSDSTSDLAVIQIPNTTLAYTVRVGNHRRIAHFRRLSTLYFSKTSKEKEIALSNLRKFSEYSIVRDLGLPADSKIGDSELKQYLEKFVTHLATEFAAKTDSNILQTSSTSGNITTLGSTIDHGSVVQTVRPVIAVNPKDVPLSDPTKFITELSRYLSPLFSNPKEAPGVGKLISQYKNTYDRELLRYSFNRIGLSQDEIASILDLKKPPDLEKVCRNKTQHKVLLKTNHEYAHYHQAKELQTKFLKLLKLTNETPSENRISLSVGVKNREGTLSKFNTQYILGKLMRFSGNCDSQLRKLESHTIKNEEPVDPVIHNWIHVSTKLCRLLTHGLDNPSAKFNLWSENARLRRPVSPQTEDQVLKAPTIHHILDVDSSDYNFESTSKGLLSMISRLADRELPEREYINSRPSGALVSPNCPPLAQAVFGSRGQELIEEFYDIQLTTENSYSSSDDSDSSDDEDEYSECDEWSESSP